LINIEHFRNLFFSFSVFIFVFFISPFHQFNLWNQVIELRGINIQFIDILTQAHFLRYLLVYPAFFLSDFTSIDANVFFQIICFINIFLATLNCISIYKFYEKNNEFIAVFFFTFLFIFMSGFMNGRITFSFLGFSYLILAIHKWERQKNSNFLFIIKTLISLFLCSVSTGTFLSCIILLVAWMLFYSNRKKGILNFYFILLFVIISPVIYLYLFKNINFYGGGLEGFINMLQHGMGFIFYIVEFNILILMLLNVIILILLLLPLYFSYNKYRLLFLMIATSLFAGLFGFSTLTLSIIPFSVFILLMITRYLYNLFPYRQNLY